MCFIIQPLQFSLNPFFRHCWDGHRVVQFIVSFEVPVEVSTKITVFSSVMSSLIKSYCCFEGLCCLCLQSRVLSLAGKQGYRGSEVSKGNGQWGDSGGLVCSNKSAVLDFCRGDKWDLIYFISIDHYYMI
jgi:hypothetical protein